MPIYTAVQNYAMGELRKLRCARHDQMCWLICLEYPDAAKYALTEMRRLVHLGKAVNDGEHYIWPGCGADPDMITAIDIMRRASGADKPIFEPRRAPCRLMFSVIKGGAQLHCGIFFPKPGGETETAAAVEQLPAGQTAAIFLESRARIPLFTISRTHIFVCPGADGGYEYTSGNEEGGRLKA